MSHRQISERREARRLLRTECRADADAFLSAGDARAAVGGAGPVAIGVYARAAEPGDVPIARPRT
ncbi:hypothetical protein [Streptomyces barringtoniae]|uniref:hypothetical protein n=1 Tax=Streptomyces barringtoniae TaxID=2892029 RepID=UPI001E2F0A03|nr:hypothetical protein [Streptomyces barringtoniae]MCC5474704.1 hypothetical protein [Streptomyces barringtoniae]